MKFLAGAPAAVVGDSLVISDVHLGIEFELQQKGLRLYPKAKAIALEINKLLNEFKCKRLIVLGDLKHNCRGFAERERKMMHEFLSHLSTKHVTVCKGNHDSELDDMPGIKLEPAEGFVLNAGGKTYGLFHGHAWPAKELLASDYLLCGNNHPLIAFQDALGHKWLEKAWITGELKQDKKRGTSKQKTVVFPAYSKLSGGIAFNQTTSRDLLGPLFKNGLFDLPNAVATGLNGVKLGKIKDLRKHVRQLD